jgi:phosphotransferase system HPr (HPr) family protein
MTDLFVTRTFVVSSKNGLHLRPAEQLARLANRFAAQIGLICESQRVDAKSIMDMLTLGAREGTSVVVEARGSDAQEAVEAILALVESEFAADRKSEEKSEAESGPPTA